MAKKNQNKDGCSQQKVEICNSSISYCYITIITSNPCTNWKLSTLKNKNFAHKLLNSCKHFIILLSLSTVHLKSQSLFLKINKEFARA